MRVDVDYTTHSETRILSIPNDSENPPPVVSKRNSTLRTLADMKLPGIMTTKECTWSLSDWKPKFCCCPLVNDQLMVPTSDVPCWLPSSTLEPKESRIVSVDVPEEKMKFAKSSNCPEPSRPSSARRSKDTRTEADRDPIEKFRFGTSGVLSEP